MSLRLVQRPWVSAAALLALSLGSVAQAAPGPKLTQFKVPTAGSSPMHITQAVDGNFWFTESFVNNQNAFPHNVGRITPAGDVTEFEVCLDCFPHDIVQGSDGVLYFTKNDASLGRIGADGAPMPDAGEPFFFNDNGLDPHGDDIWIGDFNNDAVWRYDIPTETFTEFSAVSVGAVPVDVAVAPDGIVWFADANGRIGRLDPADGSVTAFDVDGFPRQVNIATDGAVWFTERFVPQGVGRLDPDTGTVSLFAVDGGPEGIAPGANGSMWFTRSTRGTIAQINTAGQIVAESKVVKNSDPIGITVAADGDPWFTMMGADKIARLDLP